MKNFAAVALALLISIFDNDGVCSKMQLGCVVLHQHMRPVQANVTRLGVGVSAVAFLLFVVVEVVLNFWHDHLD